MRYPLIELSTGLVSGFVAYRFGFGFAAFAALGFTWCMIVLSAIDVETMLLPDVIVVPALWAGLLLSLGNVFVDLHSSLIGAVAGYLALWSVYMLFKVVTGKEGMGHGDFKLLALIGAWMGWQSLPAVILIASVIGAVLGITLIAAARHDRGRPLPFGPFLAGAGWLELVWHEQLQSAYFTTFGSVI